MTLTRINNQPSAGQVTYRWQVSGTSAIADRKADQAAHYYFDLGDGDHGTEQNPRTFDMLTAAEKLTILDSRLRELLVNASKSYVANRDVEAARKTATNTEDSEIVTIK